MHCASTGSCPRRAIPDQIRALAAFVEDERSAAGPFDIVVEGTTPLDPGEAADAVRPLADAGATWWIEADWSGATMDSLRRRIAAGPPAVSG